MSRAVRAKAAPTTIFFQLGLRLLDERLLDQCRDGDLDPVLGRGWMAEGRTASARLAGRPEGVLARSTLPDLAAAVVGADRNR